MRSLLCVRGDDAEALAAAFDAGADAVVIGFAGGPSPGRAAARRTALSFLMTRAGRTSQPAVFIVLHEADGPIRDADLEALMPTAPDGVVLPRSAEPFAVALLDSRLAVQEALHGLPDRSTRIIAEAGGRDAPLPSAERYRAASPRLSALAWTPDARWLANPDPNAPSGASDGPENLARNLVLFAAAGAGLPAIHPAWPDPADRSGLERTATSARSNGFAAMLAVDGAQVAALNTIFG